jgi:anti-sigma factor RsiW
MLSEKTLQLLTSFVDGELAPPRRKLAGRVLQISSEARQVVKELQQNAHRLHQLPQRTLEPEFAVEIVRILRQRNGILVPHDEPVHASEERPATLPMQPLQPLRRRFSKGTRYAAAAALLLAASAGIYLATRPPETTNNTVVALQNDKKKNQGSDHGSAIAALTHGAAGAFGQPVPADRAGKQFAFTELKEEKAVAELAKTIGAAKAVHLEVAVKDRAQAVRQLDKALRGQNINLVVDRVAEKKLGDPAAKTEYVLYAENVTPAELTALLGSLAQGQTFETMTVSTATGDDQQQVALLMGVERKQLEAAPMNAVDPFQKAIPKDNGNKPGIASIQKQAPPTAPRTALVLANESREPGARLSSEVMSFLQSRRQAKPGTLQVIVVIHQI